MDLIESCKQIGIVVDETSSYDQIIESLKERPDSDRMDIQLVLGVAQQEKGDYQAGFGLTIRFCCHCLALSCLQVTIVLSFLSRNRLPYIGNLHEKGSYFDYHLTIVI